MFYRSTNENLFEIRVSSFTYTAVLMPFTQKRVWWDTKSPFNGAGQSSSYTRSGSDIRFYQEKKEIFVGEHDVL